MHRATVYVRKHLPPEGALAAAAAHGHIGNIHAHRPQNIQILPLREGYALHHGAGQIALTVHGGQAEEHAPGLGVQQRGSLAHEIGQEEQPVRADGALFRLGGHQLIGVHALRGGGLNLRLAELIAEPLQGQARRQRAAHHRPFSGHGGAEAVQPPLGIDAHLVRMGEDHAGGSQGGERTPGAHHAGADGGGGVIARAAHHGRAGGKAGGLRGGGADDAGHLAGFVHFAQQAGIDVQGIEDFFAPPAVGHVQQVHARGVGHLRGEFAGQFIPDVVLGQQDMAALAIDFRLVFPHPENLARREAGQGGVCRDGNQAVAAQPFGDFVALLLRAAVAPEDGAAQDLAVFVQHHQPVHLAGQAHALDVPGINAAGLDHRADGLTHRAPPIARLLLRPAVLGLIKRIFHRGFGQSLACFVKQDGFGAGGANIDT